SEKSERRSRKRIGRELYLRGQPVPMPHGASSTINRSQASYPRSNTAHAYFSRGPHLRTSLTFSRKAGNVLRVSQEHDASSGKKSLPRSNCRGGFGGALPLCDRS